MHTICFRYDRRFFATASRQLFETLASRSTRERQEVCGSSAPRHPPGAFWITSEVTERVHLIDRSRTFPVNYTGDGYPHGGTDHGIDHLSC